MSYIVKVFALPEKSDPIAKKIGAQIWLASCYLHDAKTLLEARSRNAVNQLFYAVEALLIATMTAEGLHINRHQHHQLGAILDTMPDENPWKPEFRPLEVLTGYATTYRYATPGGRIPKAPPQADVEGWLTATSRLLETAKMHFDVTVDTGEYNSMAGVIDPPR